MRKTLTKIFLINLMFIVPITSHALEVAVIARPSLKQENSKNHLLILSEALPKGVWEVGPDAKGKTTSTNITNNLQEWETGVETYNIIHLKSRVDVIKVNVNREALLQAVSLYEKSFVGNKYKKGDDNYAVIQTIYGAGGPKLDFK